MNRASKIKYHTRRSRSFVFVAALLCLLSARVLGAQTTALRVIEEEAIPFAAFLSKADFDQRYPGKMVADHSQLTAGWYVLYQHESLNYYFGPILLQSTGEDYLAQLQGIVGQAVAQRPTIEGYRLELRYEPSVPAAAPSGATGSGSPSSSNSSGGGTPQPSQSWGLFDFFRRLFGL